jgi:predicted  nucleic acid-binding Zn-ribbon protein
MQNQKKVNDLRIQSKSVDKIKSDKKAYIKKVETRIKDASQKASKASDALSRKAWTQQADGQREVLSNYKAKMDKISPSANSKKIKLDLTKARRKAGR